MSRVHRLPDDTSDPEVTAVYARVRESAGGVSNLYRTLANAPKLFESWIGYAWSLRADATVSRGLRELGIMRVAQLSDCDYVWRSHWRMARAEGYERERLESLSGWRDQNGFSDEERAVLAAAEDMTATTRISNEIWDELCRFFDERAAVELVLTFAWYACVVRVNNSLQVPIDESALRAPPVNS
jgi:AhpD family alkylhydroperoxidase